MEEEREEIEVVEGSEVMAIAYYVVNEVMAYTK